MHKNTYVGEHAVVIGGSMAGLLTASALSEHFAAVTLVERDQLPEGPEVRKGVPQARHIHTFWAGGLQAVERLLPGLRAELVEAGAIPLAIPVDIAWLTPADRWTQPFEATQGIVSASRTLLEWAVRRRVRTIRNIHVLTGQETTGLLLDERGDVRGTTVRDRRCGDVLEIDADLVVDASGRGSALPDWLAAHGLPTPAESTVDSFLGYATRLYDVPADRDRDWKAAYIQPAPPTHTRGGILFPIEGNRWVVTLIGGGGDYPPTDDDGFMEFARSLRDPLLHDAIDAAVPASPIWGYRRTSNRRRHFERIAMPGRLIALGDSLCAFNPAYGQGMTVAAKEVEALATRLRSCGSRRELTAVVREAQRVVATCADGPWMLSTTSDLRYPGVEGARPTLPTRIVNRYMDRVIAAVADDQVVNEAFLRVLNMVEPPQSLFHPRIVRRVLPRRRGDVVAFAPGRRAVPVKQPAS